MLIVVMSEGVVSSVCNYISELRSRSASCKEMQGEDPTCTIVTQYVTPPPIVTQVLTEYISCYSLKNTLLLITNSIIIFHIYILLMSMSWSNL